MSSWQTFEQNFLDWSAMGDVLPDLLTYGLRNTLILSLGSFALGCVVGLVLALLGLSERWWVRLPARIYTDIFRGLPAILTILIIGQGVILLSASGDSPYPIAIVALGLMSGAYIGEIFRSGIQSVDKGQGEACRALGMTYFASMRLVVIPQGIRRVLPAMVNQLIGNIKDSSLVYFLGLVSTERELFRIGQDAAVTTGTLSALVATGAVYLAITVPLTHLVNYWDRRLRTGKRKPVKAPVPPDGAGAAAPAPGADTRALQPAGAGSLPTPAPEKE